MNKINAERKIIIFLFRKFKFDKTSLFFKNNKINIGERYIKTPLWLKTIDPNKKQKHKYKVK